MIALSRSSVWFSCRMEKVEAQYIFDRPAGCGGGGSVLILVAVAMVAVLVLLALLVRKR